MFRIRNETNLAKLKETTKVFIVAYINDQTREGVLIARVNCLSEARAKRQVCGDLVFDADTLCINQCRRWLWSWEADDTSAYVHRARLDLRPIHIIDRGT